MNKGKILSKFQPGYIIISILFAFLTFFIYSIQHAQLEQRITIKNLINGSPFDSYSDGEAVLSNGLKIKVDVPINFPADRIIHYEDITLSIANDNGAACVVGVFDKRGKEIFLP